MATIYLLTISFLFSLFIGTELDLGKRLDATLTAFRHRTRVQPRAEVLKPLRVYRLGQMRIYSPIRQRGSK